MAGSARAQISAPTRVGSVTGLDVPRYVSLKASRVNVRRGPGRDYPIAWVFRQIGFPVEIIGEADIWRQIRDSEGAEGWIHARLLSGRRTALVTPWVKPAQGGSEAPTIALRSQPSQSGRVLARLGPGMLVNVHECDSVTCAVSIDDYRGRVEQTKLWGVYPDERFD